MQLAKFGIATKKNKAVVSYSLLRTISAVNIHNSQKILEWYSCIISALPDIEALRFK